MCTCVYFYVCVGHRKGNNRTRWFVCCLLVVVVIVV